MLKQVARYYMKLNGEWAERSALLAGGAFFLRVVYYFGFRDVTECGFWEILTGMILPIALWAAYFILLRGMRMNAPGMYALLGAGFCMLTILGSFSSGMVMHIILSIIYYPLLTLLLLATTGGYVDDKRYLAAASMILLVLRFLIFDLKTYILSFSLIAFLPEASTLCGLGAIFCLALSLQKKKLS